MRLHGMFSRQHQVLKAGLAGSAKPTVGGRDAAVELTWMYLQRVGVPTLPVSRGTKQTLSSNRF
jgi:hypothetical protein